MGSCLRGLVGRAVLFYAVSAATGATRWSFATGARIDQTSPRPSRDGTAVYFGTSGGGGTVFAVDAGTGAERWRFATGAPVYSSPALSADETTLFIGSGDNRLRALDAATDTPRWSFATGNHVDASPALSADGSAVYVGSGDGSVYALDAATGALRWRFATKFWVYATPALSTDGGTLFVGSEDDSVYAVDAFTGALRWNFTTRYTVPSRVFRSALARRAHRVRRLGRRLSLRNLQLMQQQFSFSYNTRTIARPSAPAVPRFGCFMSCFVLYSRHTTTS